MGKKGIAIVAAFPANNWSNDVMLCLCFVSFWPELWVQPLSLRRLPTSIQFYHWFNFSFFNSCVSFTSLSLDICLAPLPVNCICLPANVSYTWSISIPFKLSEVSSYYFLVHLQHSFNFFFLDSLDINSTKTTSLQSIPFSVCILS